MKYVLLTKDNRVKEVIPDFNPQLPGITIEDRYAPDFLAQCISVEDSVFVEPNMQYVPEDGTFIVYVPPVPPLIPEQGVEVTSETSDNILSEKGTDMIADKISEEND